MTEIQKFQTESFWSFGIGAWNLFGLPARSRSRLREAPASAGVGRSAKAGICHLVFGI
jgi:hypothetical protein